MLTRADVLCGQINLHKGTTGATNLLSYLQTCMHTGTPPSQRFYQSGGGAQTTRGAKIKSFLISLQEPPVHNSRVVGLGTQQNVFFDRTTDRPRTAIFASRDLQLWAVPEFTTKDLTTCIWLKDGREVFVASAYFDINLDSVVPTILNRLLQHCDRKRKEVIICADTNAHSSLWNSMDTNSRGEILEEWIFQHNLEIQNNGDHFTFFRRDVQTIIDVTFTRGPLISREVKNWRVSEEVLGSDHLLIEWRFTISPTALPQTRNMIKGDWPQFQVCLEEISRHKEARLRTRWTSSMLNSAAYELTKDITDCLDQSHPLYTPRPKVMGLPHFDGELLRWKKKVRACYSNYRKHKTDFTFEQFRDARRKYKSKIKKVKKESWKQFLEDADNPTKVSHINRIIQGKVNQTLGMMKNSDGTACSSPEDSLLRVINTHFPGNRMISPVQEEDGTTIVNIHHERANFITSEKVGEAIKTFKDHKAPGPDGLQPCVLKHLDLETLDRLTNLYKASYLLGYVPKVWRDARVIFIPKPGKDDYSQPRSFRPITLSSFLIKVMERVILWQIQDHNFIEYPLSDNQHAFRGGRSTETALTDLVERIEGAFSRKEYAIGVFLDIQGAFDNVTAKAIVEGMKGKHLPDNLIKWYHHYVTNRSMNVNHNGVEITRYLTRGTPQGGVLSPVMWNLVFEKLLSLFEEGRVKAVGFADDAALLITGSNPHVMISHLETSLQKALDRGHKCGLKFSTAKTAVMLFTRKYKVDTPRELRMEGKIIPFAQHTRYLGVILDTKLSWRKHLDSKVKAAKFKLLKVRNAMGKLWGTRPLETRWIYTGIIRPAFSYGALVWARVSRLKTAIAAMTKVNRLALMSTSYYRRSTPTAGLEVILDVMPLHIYLQYEACLALNRTHFTKSGTGNLIHRRIIPGGHREFCQRLLDQLDLELIQSDRIIPRHIWERYFLLDKESFLTGKPNTMAPGSFSIYTDGSGKDELFGGGFAAYKDNVSANSEVSNNIFHLGADSSVFQGEVYAIKAAALWIKDRLMGKTITIYSDSRAALCALNKTKIKSELVLETRQALAKAGQVNRITLKWVKAHKGHEGNERADELAKLGANPQTLCEDTPNIPESLIKMRFKRKFRSLWQEYWTNRQDCRQTKQWLPTINRSVSYEILGLQRRTLSWVVQLITGHNHMRRHEAIVNDEGERECRLCLEEEESSFHIMAECPALARPRHQVFGQAFQNTPLQWSTKKVVSFVREASIDNLLDPAGLYGLAE